MYSGHDYKVSIKIIPILPWVSIAVDIEHNSTTRMSCRYTTS